MSLPKTIASFVGDSVLVDIDDLHWFQGELKSLDKQDFDKLRTSIIEEGVIDTVNVWENEKKQLMILDGHQTKFVLNSLRADGYSIPKVKATKILAPNFKKAKAYVLLMSSTYGKLSGESLSQYFIDAELDFTELSKKLDLPGVDLDLEDFNVSGGTEGLTDEDEIPEVVEPKAKRGDIYKLGNHRLMCGDSTSEADVSKLMDGEKADITFTSPPYNLGDNAKLRGYNGDGDDSAYRTKSDHKTQDDYLQFLIKFTDLALNNSKYQFINIQLLAGNKLIMSEYWSHFKNHLADLMIWDKEHAAPQMDARVLNSVFEMIFIFSNQEFPSRAINSGKEFRGTLQNIFRLNPMRGGKDEFQKDHGAVFPMAFAEFFIDQFSNGSVLDLFGGSGTTMIAAEKTGKSSYLMELDEHYTDVIIARWEAFTGQTAELVSQSDT